MRDDVRDSILELFEPRAIYERSDHPARHDEGLKPVTQALHGKIDGPVQFLEHGRKCFADVTDGQKTGFFLDLRDLRQEVSQLAEGRRVADLFSNAGAGGLAALLGGAKSVHFVDSSERALDLCGRHVDLNDISRENVRTIKDDVFQWLADKDEPEYDMVLLDPPALIKSRRHYETGRKGYHFLNRAAMRVLNDGGILASSSCSAFFSEDDLAVTLRRAADQAGVTLSLIKTVRQSPDHPLSVYFPESLYLKSFICQINR
jgi:23S rRNA (cytosine1962-C5)-methyltransferase